MSKTTFYIHAFIFSIYFLFYFFYSRFLFTFDIHAWPIWSTIVFIASFIAKNNDIYFLLLFIFISFSTLLWLFQYDSIKTNDTARNTYCWSIITPGTLYPVYLGKTLNLQIYSSKKSNLLEKTTNLQFNLIKHIIYSFTLIKHIIYSFTMVKLVYTGKN